MAGDGWEDAPAKSAGGWESAPTSPKPAPVTPTPSAARQPSIADAINNALKLGATMSSPLGIAAKGTELGNAITDKVAYKAGGATTDLLSKAGLSPEMAALGGYGVNVGVESIPVIAGGAIAKAAFRPQGEELGRRWMQQALKPTKGELESGRAQKGMELLLKENVPVSEGGVERLNKSIDKLQDEMVRSLRGNPNVVEPHKVIKELDSVFDAYRKQATPNADMATIQKALNEFINHPLISGQGTIPLDTANAIKSGTYKAIGDKGYGAGLKPEAERDALKGIARGLQREIAAQPGVPQGVGQRQADLINARDVLEDRLLMARNRNELGLGGIAPHWWNYPLWLLDRSPRAKGFAARQAYQGTVPAITGEIAGGAVGGASGMAPKEQRR